MGLLLHSSARPVSTEDEKPWNEIVKEIDDRLIKFLTAGPENLLVPTLVAMGIDSQNSANEWLSHLREEPRDQVKDRVREAARDNQLEKEAEQIIDVPPHGQGFGVGGSQ